MPHSKLLPTDMQYPQIVSTSVQIQDLLGGACINPDKCTSPFCNRKRVTCDAPTASIASMEDSPPMWKSGAQWR
jgi:hypothetical protein